MKELKVGSKINGLIVKQVAFCEDCNFMATDGCTLTQADHDNVYGECCPYRREDGLSVCFVKEGE